MKKVNRAIGYVCDIPIQGTDMVITKEDQRARMIKYCEKEGLELVCVYEDDQYAEDFMNRPGIQKLLDCKENCDTVLVERVWSLSRKMKELKPFMSEARPQEHVPGFQFLPLGLREPAGPAPLHGIAGREAESRG